MEQVTFPSVKSIEDKSESEGDCKGGLGGFPIFDFFSQIYFIFKRPLTGLIE
jgi:hypothetical protein